LNGDDESERCVKYGGGEPLNKMTPNSSESTLSSGAKLAPVAEQATGENDNVETPSVVVSPPDDHDAGERVQVVDVHIPPATMKGFSENLKR